MAGINQGQPEMAVGEPIRFGDIDGFELEQHPVSDRLIIRDTANGTVAYVRAERGGSIGGDGVLVRALRENKPMADTGRTYDTIQEAEREASSWVFVPPGTYNESVEINTEGLTLQGSGENSTIDGGSIGNAININENNVTVSQFSTRADAGTTNRAIEIRGSDALISNIHTLESDFSAILANSDGESPVITSCLIESSSNGIAIDGTSDSGAIVSNNILQSPSNDGVFIEATRQNTIVTNNIIIGAPKIGIDIDGNDTLILGNRVMNSGDRGIFNQGDNSIIANNRISDSTNGDINDSSTGTLLDGNLTGLSN